MAKLSTIYHLIGSYLTDKGDKEVTSIGSVSGDRKSEYIFHLHDAHEGKDGCSQYTGKDTILIPKEPERHPSRGSAEKLLEQLVWGDENSVIHEFLSLGFTEKELVRCFGFNKKKVMNAASMIRRQEETTWEQQSVNRKQRSIS